jgi:hypothetical protein
MITNLSILNLKVTSSRNKLSENPVKLQNGEKGVFHPLSCKFCNQSSISDINSIGVGVDM